MGHCKTLTMHPMPQIKSWILLIIPFHTLVYWTAGNAGYKVYKYLPYGPVNEVIPYLIRRSQENSALLGSESTKKMKKMLSEEMKRRYFGWHRYLYRTATKLYAQFSLYLHKVATLCSHSYNTWPHLEVCTCAFVCVCVCVLLAVTSGSGRQHAPALLCSGTGHVV